MPMHSLRPFMKTRPGWTALIVTTLVGLLLVFFLPTRFPPPPAFSESYLFGFNNHLCEILFGALLIAVAVLTKLGRLRLPGDTGHSGVEKAESLNSDTGEGGLTVRMLAVCLAIDAVLCGMMCWLADGLGGLNDGAYYLDRIHLIVRGEVPYRDFEFLYGSTPLYGAVAIGRLLHISPETGFYLIWACGTVLGIFLLWLSIRWLELPAGGKRTVFFIYYVLLSLMIRYATLNYFSLRYTLPLFALIGLCRLDRDGRLVTRAEVILFAVVMTAVLFGISPEEAIVYAVAVCLYLPLRRYYTQRSFAVDLVVLIAALAGVCAVVAHAGTLRSMSSFSAGAWNLPIYPGPDILLAFAAVIGMVFYLATQTTAESAKSNVLLAVLYGLGMLPGALGRCDDTHIAGYLLTIFVCAMLLSRRWLPMWRGATICFAVFFLLLPFATGTLWRQSVLETALFNHLYKSGSPQGRIDIAVDHLMWRAAVAERGRERASAKMAELRKSYSQTLSDPRRIFPGVSPVVAVPFEYRPNTLNNYQAPWVDEGYFMGTLNIMTSRDVEKKIDELKSHPGEDLIYPAYSCGISHGDIRKFLGELLLLPWVPRQKHQMTTLDPYCDYIHQNYDIVFSPSPTTFGYGLMRRKPGK